MEVTNVVTKRLLFASARSTDSKQLIRRVRSMKKKVGRAIIEISFIVFLFYSNLLMGEFERSAPGARRGIVWAMEDVFTVGNFEFAMIAALIGYLFVEFLRKRF